MKISIVGNCQAQNLAACTQAMLPGAEVHGIVGGDSLDVAIGSDIILVQTHDAPYLGEEFQSSLLKSIPVFWYWGFHPDLVYAKVGDSYVQSAIGDYNSALVLYGWLNDLSPSQTTRLFCDAVYEHLHYHDYGEPSARYLMRAGANSGIDMAALLQAWRLQGCFAYSVNHPKLFVLSSIVRAALEQCGVTIAVANPEKYLHDWLVDSAIWPVYSELAERLGVEGSYGFKAPAHPSRALEILDLEQFVERSFACYASVPREKIHVERFVEQQDRYRDLKQFVLKARRRPANPYSALPDYCFWQRSMTGGAAMQLDPVVQPKFKISKDAKIATAGSCFAQHIARTLISAEYNYFVAEPAPSALSPEAAATRGYGLFSARFGNVYSVRQLLQLLQRAYSQFSPDDTAWRRHDGRLIDPFRPQIEPDGYASVDDVVTARTEHLAAVRRMFEQSNLFVFTIGLTEAWTAKSDGAVFPIAPGVVGGSLQQSTEYRFVNFTVSEIIADLNEFIRQLRAVNERVLVLFTVSPVPLVATYENRHVLVSTTYSKSAIRAAVGEVIQQYEFTDYFPSYEIITTWQNGGRYFESDLRSVTAEGVGHVMRIFSKHYLDSAPRPTVASGKSSGLTLHREIASAARILCDEELLMKGPIAAGDVARAAANPAPWMDRSSLEAPAGCMEEIIDVSEYGEPPALTGPNRILAKVPPLPTVRAADSSELHALLAQERALRGAALSRIERAAEAQAAIYQRRITAMEASLDAKVGELTENLASVRSEYEATRETVHTLVERVQSWLLPMLARHSAAIERGRRPFGALRRWAGRFAKSATRDKA